MAASDVICLSSDSEADDDVQIVEPMFSPPMDTRVPLQEHQAPLPGSGSVDFSDRDAVSALLQIAQADPVPGRDAVPAAQIDESTGGSGLRSEAGPQRASAGADPVPGRDAVPAAQTDAGPGGPGLCSEAGPRRASAGASPTALWENTKKWVDQIRKATPDKQKFLNHLQIDESSLEAWYTAGSASSDTTKKLRQQIKLYMDRFRRNNAGKQRRRQAQPSSQGLHPPNAGYATPAGNLCTARPQSAGVASRAMGGHAATEQGGAGYTGVPGGNLCTARPQSTGVAPRAMGGHAVTEQGMTDGVDRHKPHTWFCPRAPWTGPSSGQHTAPEEWHEGDGLSSSVTPTWVPCDNGPFKDTSVFPVSAGVDIVESMSLANATTQNPTIKLQLPSKMMRDKLAPHQLRAVQLVLHQWARTLPNGDRSGFCLGDGPGVGKTRVVAASILSFLLQCDFSVKCFWLSANMDLMHSAVSEMRLMGASRVQCVEIDQFLSKGDQAQGHVVFTTYRRFQQNLLILLDLIPKDYAGVIALDECHLAKNLDLKQSDLDGTTLRHGSGSKVAAALDVFQKKLPNARILYVTGTLADEPEHLGQMQRLGLWGERTGFANAREFISNIRSGGEIAMELVAVDLKSRSSMLARCVSQECETKMEGVEVDEELQKKYDGLVALWQKLEDDFRSFRDTSSFMNRNFHLEKVNSFQQLILACKVPHAVKRAQEASSDGYAVVLSLQDTGQSYMASDEPDASSLFSAIERSIAKFIQAHYHPEDPKRKEQRLQDLKDLKLPGNTIDVLIDKLGGSSQVAELSSRVYRMERKSADGNELWIRTKCPGKARDLRAFQTNGQKPFVLVLPAGETGINLNAEDGQAPRLLMVLQYTQSAQKWMQLLGRVNRFRQAKVPKFLFLYFPYGAEAKTISTLARRIQAMGAFTQGDRRCSGHSNGAFQDLFIPERTGDSAVREIRSVFDIGHPSRPLRETVPKVLEQAVAGTKYEPTPWRFLQEYKYQHAFTIMPKGKDCLRTFLNAVTACPLQCQRVMMGVFMEFVKIIKAADDVENSHCSGTVNLSGPDVKVVKKEVLFRCPETTMETQWALVEADRGLGFARAQQMLQEHCAKTSSHAHSGFFKAWQRVDELVDKTPLVMLVLMRHNDETKVCYADVYRPNTGKFLGNMDLKTLFENYRLIEDELEVKSHWDKLYNFYGKACGHHNCQIANCTYKKRFKQHHVLHGNLLSFWTRIRRILGTSMCIMQVTPAGEDPILGVLVPAKHKADVWLEIRKGGPITNDFIRKVTEPRLNLPPELKLEKVLVVQRCQSVDNYFSIELPAGWRDSGQSCVMALYEMEAVVGASVSTSPLRANPWFVCRVLRIRDGPDISLDVVKDRALERERRQGVVRERAPKHESLVPDTLRLDEYLKEGMNRLLFVCQSDTRVCVAVMLVSDRSMAETVRDLSVIADDEKNMAWGRKLLNGGTGDSDIVVTDLDVSLTDPLSMARIKTPVRGVDCKHFGCMDLEVFLQYQQRHREWKCAVCSELLVPSQLTRCLEFEKLLAQAKDDDANVAMAIDGSAVQSEADGLDAAKGEVQGDIPAQPGPSSAGLHDDPWIAKLLATGVWEQDAHAEDFYSEPSVLGKRPVPG